MRHHVAQLARDLQPFLADLAAHLGQLLTCTLLSLLAQAGRTRVLLPHPVPGHPRHDDQQPALQQQARGRVGAARAVATVRDGGERDGPGRYHHQRARASSRRASRPGNRNGMR